MSPQFLIWCSHCRVSWLSEKPPDGSCPKCHRDTLTASAPTILDPANPSNFPETKKGYIASTIPRPTMFDPYDGMAFPIGSREPQYLYWSREPAQPQANNAHMSEIGEMTLADIQQAFNEAWRGVRYAVGVDRAEESDLTKEWHRPEPPKPTAERVEFPTDRKIQVK